MKWGKVKVVKLKFKKVKENFDYEEKSIDCCMYIHRIIDF